MNRDSTRSIGDATRSIGDFTRNIGAVTRRQGAIIIAVIASLLYFPSVFNLFAYDDVAVIPDDPRIHSLHILTHIFSINYWNNQAQAIYRPLVTGSFAIEWAIASNHPGWYHFINLLWNAGACVLAFLVLAELFPVFAAFAGALVFTVHPVHVEAVANVVGRAELMAAVFSLAAALLWIRSPRRITLNLGVPALFLLALLSKESAIMLPPMLILLDIGTGKLRVETFATWLRERIVPLVAVTVAACVFLLLRAHVIPTLAPSNLDAALEVQPHGLPRVLTALQVWPVILRLFVFPRVLIADYGPRLFLPQTTFTPLVTIGALIFAGLIIGGIIAAMRGYGRTALAFLWVPVALLPVSNLLFPIGIILAERTLYLAVLAPAIAVAAVVSYAPSARGTWIVVACICAAFAARSLVRIPDWKNTQTIFDAMMRSRPDSFRAHWQVARKASDAHDPARAMQAYATAINLWPYRTRLLKEAADYALKQKQLDFARQIDAQGVRAWPRNVDFRRSLAAVTLRLGDTTQAIVQVRAGLALAPTDSALRAMLTSVEGHK